MIQAELKGKLPEVENKEDILTSNVFGLLKYVPKHVLLEVLNCAKTLSGKKFKDCVNVSLEKYEAEIIFWKNIGHYGEPDIIIKFTNKDEEELILCIEVKYYSSKSGEGEDDQLRRYFEGLNKLSGKSESQFLGVIYLTMSPSHKELAESLECIKKKGLKNAERKLFQLRWFEITKVIQEYNKESLNKNEKLILEDLEEYLKAKNLVEFTKFSYQIEDFDTSLDRFYEIKVKRFDGFSFQTSDFDCDIDKKIVYG